MTFIIKPNINISKFPDTIYHQLTEVSPWPYELIDELKEAMFSFIYIKSNIQPDTNIGRIHYDQGICYICICNEVSHTKLALVYGFAVCKTCLF